MEQENVLIVYAHQNPHTSFNAALKDEAIKVFVDNGHNVKMSDLYSQHWDPRATASDFEGSPPHSELSNYFNEQLYATKQGTTSKVIQAEQKKLKEADLVIFQFPVYWFSVPAILKGWFDKVFAVGVTHGFPDNVYENGLMKGKKAMLSLTTGATQEMYSTSGNHGDMNMILWPIQWGTLRYVGFDVLQPNIAFSVLYSSEDDRQNIIDCWKRRLQNIFSEEALKLKEAQK